MTLVVSVPPGYDPERRYILDLVLSTRFGLDWQLARHEHPDVRLRLPDQPDRAVTVPDVFFALPSEHWLTPQSLPSLPLARLPVGAAGSRSLAEDEHLPVLFPPRDAEPSRLLTVDEHGAHLGVDVFGGAFFMLTRYEEIVLADARDHYDRFPASASLAKNADFLQLPIVDAYVELLATAIERVWPQLRCRRGDYRVMLTHDVDDPLSTAGRRPVQLARQFAGDLILRKDLGLMARRARAIASALRGNHAPDPHNTFDFLMDVSERHGVRGAFYFLPHNDVNPRAPRYHLFDHPWVRRLMRHIHQRGHEVGLHPGFGTYRDSGRTTEEFLRLRDIANTLGVTQEHWGGRQHFLQWANPTTWRNWNTAGLSYDCTLAFADQVGFRTGTCHEYPVFDLLDRRALSLVEKPFQVMDVTLFGYQSLGPEDAWNTTMRIARECRRFQGTLGILWHNDELLRTTREKRWYVSLVAAITAC